MPVDVGILATAFTGILPSGICSGLVADPSNTVRLECPFRCDDEVNDEGAVHADDHLSNDCRGFGSRLCSDNNTWVDEKHNTCSWYEVEDDPGCPNYGHRSSSDNITAIEACCYCGGGKCSSCYNTLDTTCANDHQWTAVIASETISCEWFEENDDPGCAKTLNEFLTMSNVSDPRESCCYCSEYPAPTSSPSLTPTDGPPCFDYIGWLDLYGHGCDWYESYDDPGCPNDDPNYADSEGITASIACCYCNGGWLETPSAFPTSSDTPSYKYDPSSTPSLTPTDGPPCYDYIGWLDSEGDGCDWYESYDDPGCPNDGPYYADSEGITASVACCYCNGGLLETPSAFPTSSDAPSYKYDPSSTPSLTPTDGPPCYDYIGWLDFYGDECDWYESYDDPGCPNYGPYYADSEGVTASVACCYCNGGLEFSSAFPTSSNAPSYKYDPSSTPSLTPTDGPPCYDYIGWLDFDGYGCDWYESYDVPGCSFYGPYYADSEGVTASKACCYCNGGWLEAPSAFPTSSNAPSYKYDPSSTPSLTPTDGPPCYDYIGWLDFYGSGCDLYESYDDPGCPLYGTYYEDSEGVTASAACCYCNGGVLGLLEYDNLYLRCDGSDENWQNSVSYKDIPGDNETCRVLHYLFDSSTQSERAYIDLLKYYCEELHNDTMFMSEACCFCALRDGLIVGGMTAGDASCTHSDLQIPRPWPERNCEWFDRDPSRCKDFGDETILIDGNNGIKRTANEVCCACGGGTQRCHEFIDIWTDSHPDTSYDCNDYDSYNRCAADGSGFISLGHSADTQCCVCGGGYSFENDNVITNVSQHLCIDEKDWVGGGLLCTHFNDDRGAPDVELCLARGHVLSIHGVNASDACCDCWYGYDAVTGGGYRGMLIGKVLRIGMMNYTDIQYVHNLNSSGNIDDNSTIYEFIRNASEAYGFGLIQYDLNDLNETRGLGRFPDDSYSACLTGELSMEFGFDNLYSK